MVLLSSKSRLDSTISPFLMMTKHEREEKHKWATKNIMKGFSSSSFLSPPIFCNVCDLLPLFVNSSKRIITYVNSSNYNLCFNGFRDSNTESYAQSFKHRIANSDRSHACIPLTNDRKTFTTIHRPKTICHKHNLWTYISLLHKSLSITHKL